MDPAQIPNDRPEKHPKLENTDKEHLYQLLEERDSKIRDLEVEQEQSAVKAATLNNQIRQLKSERKHYEQTHKEMEAELLKVKEERQKVKNELQGVQQQCKDEEIRANQSESKVEHWFQRYKTVAEECDSKTAMVEALHEMAGEYEQKLGQAHQDIEAGKLAADALEVIENAFEEVYTEHGVQLTPQNLLEHFNSMNNMSTSKIDRPGNAVDERPAGRPGLNGRKVSVASLGEEMAAAESDEDSDNRSVSPVVRTRSRKFDSRSSESDQRRRDSEESTNSVRDRLLSPQKNLSIAQEMSSLFGSGVGSEETWSVTTGETSPVEEGHPQEILGTGSFTEPGDAHSETAEPRKASNGLPIAQEIPNDSKLTDPLNKRIIELETERKVQDEELLDLRNRLNERASKPTTAPPITKHIYRSIKKRELTFFESLECAPWWTKLIVMLMTFAWAALTLSAWRERNLWLASNDATFLYGRRLQATKNQCHWAIIEWIENYIGVNRKLLG